MSNTRNSGTTKWTDTATRVLGEEGNYLFMIRRSNSYRQRRSTVAHRYHTLVNNPTLFSPRLRWRSYLAPGERSVERGKDQLIDSWHLTPSKLQKVTPWRNTILQITGEVLTAVLQVALIPFSRGLGENKSEWAHKAEIDWGEFLAVSETRKAICWSTPGFKRENLW